MGKINENKGYGVARDGRHFSPAIPSGATVSWKRLPSAIHVDEHNKTATHLLAVWDRFDEMNVSACDLRTTARGRCVVFLADLHAIQRLVESPVPRPAWLNPDEEDARVLAVGLTGLHAQWVSPLGTTAGPSVMHDFEWLKAAVIVFHYLTNQWPILQISVPRVLHESTFPAERLRAEATRLFEAVRSYLAGHAAVTRPVATALVARRV